MATFAISPGIYSTEVDVSTSVTGISTSIGAAAYISNQGPMGLQFYTSRDSFTQVNGNPDPSLGYGMHSILAFLTESSAFWGNRVVDGALYGGISVYKDLNGTAIDILQWTAGEANNYLDGAPDIQGIVFSAPIVASNSISITYSIVGTSSSGTPVNTSTTVTQVYSTSSNATLTALAAALQTSINSYISGSTVSFNSVDNALALLVVAPQNAVVTFTAGTVTLGASQATVSFEDLKLFDVFANNPGAWNNTIGVQITGVDPGTPMRQNLVFSAALVTGNSVVITLNGTALAAVSFVTDSNTTMAAIATAIQTALGGNGQAYVNVVNGGNNLSRTITVVAASAFSTGDFTISGVVTGGASQATISATEIITPIRPNNTFELNVYTTASLTSPVEQFTVSLALQSDAYGNSANIAQVINNGAAPSQYINVIENTAAETYLMPTSTSLPITLLTGGANGILPTSYDLINGLQIFANRETVDYRIMIGCGYAVPSVQQAMDLLCSTRQDSMAVLEIPSTSQSSTNAVTYRKTLLNINSTYSAIYTPDLLIADTYTKQTLYIPPSGYLAAVYAVTDRFATWLAPAGPNRANLGNVIQGLRYIYGIGDRNILFPAQVNYVQYVPGVGYPVMGAETLQSQSSALSNINVRRLLIYCELSIIQTLFFYEYEPDDPVLWQSIVTAMTAFVSPIQAGRGLRSFAVISDTTNNTGADQDQGIVNVAFLILPTIPAKFILLTTYVTASGANFEELVAPASYTSS